MPLADQYAAFIKKLEWAHLPIEVRKTSFELFSDWFANAVAGFASPLTQALTSLSPSHFASVRAVRVGDLQSAEPLWAALINASAAHALEFDDSYRAGLYHPGAPIAAAAFSAACRQGKPGSMLLAAMVGGYEISLRLASAINPSHYKIWHTTGTVGTFGATASAAHVLELGTQQIAAAFGLAGTQAAGLWEVLPATPQAKNLHPAKAAYGGLLSALLAERDIRGPATIFEGPRGFFAATVPDLVEGGKCTLGLGSNWLILDTTFKAYPVCGHAMTPIEASLKLHGQFDHAQIEAIEVRAHPVSLQVAGQRFPADEAQAKFSIPYCVAAALLKGRVGHGEFSKELIESSQIDSILKKVSLIPEDLSTDIPGRRPAKVTISLSGGKSISATADVRKGDPEMPMTADEKRAKMTALIEQAWKIRDNEEFSRRFDSLPESSSVLAWVEGLSQVIEIDR